MGMQNPMIDPTTKTIPDNLYWIHKKFEAERARQEQKEWELENPPRCCIDDIIEKLEQIFNFCVGKEGCRVHDPDYYKKWAALVEKKYDNPTQSNNPSH